MTKVGPSQPGVILMDPSGDYTGPQDYANVSASSANVTVGNASGDFLVGVLAIPATTSPGAVTLWDGATALSIFAGGANSVASLIPFDIPIQAFSKNGTWKISTGGNISVIARGKLTAP